MTDTNRLVINHEKEKKADITLDILEKGAPSYKRPYEINVFDNESIKEDKYKNESPISILKKMIESPNLCSRRWVWEQYDHMVMTDTVLLPGGDSAIIRVHGTNKGLSVTSDSTPRYCASDPFEGGKQAVAEAWRNLISVGSTPIAITDCMNFGNPEKKEIMGQFAGVIKGMIEACNTLDFPVVSGNVSLYNETNGKGINPTPVIGGVGVVNNLDIFSDQNFKRINDLILVIGKTNGHLTQSIYANELLNYKKGLPPKVDLEEELKNGLALKELITKRLIDTSHDISDGGLLVALTEMSMKNNIGYKVNITKENLNSYLFGEDQARYAVAIEKSKIEEVRSFLIDKNIFFEEIGQTNKDNIIFNDEKISVAELRDLYENWFNDYLSEA